MTNSSYTKIFAGYFIMIQRIVLELKEVGVVAIVKDQAESARLAGFGVIASGFQEVFIHNDEFEKTMEIMNNYESHF